MHQFKDSDWDPVPPAPWYRMRGFPLLPIIIFQKKTEHLPWRIEIHWLVFTLLSFVVPELSVCICFNQGFRACVSIMYFQLAMYISIPDSWATWSKKNLWRLPKHGIIHDDDLSV